MSTLATTNGRGVTGSRPAAGEAGRLYYDTTTSIWYRDNGSSWDSQSPSALVNPMTTRGDIITATTSGTPQRLALPAAAQGYVSDGTDVVTAEILPWRIQIIPMISTPDASTGTWALNYDEGANILYPFYRPGSVANSGGASEFGNAATHAQNDAISYNVVLAKGTWDCNVWVRKTSVSAIITLNQDGSSMGTADTYAAATAAGKVSITGFSVSSTGKHVMQFKAATKNASSSDYYLLFHGIEFRRTA